MFLIILADALHDHELSRAVGKNMVFHFFFIEIGKPGNILSHGTSEDKDLDTFQEVDKLNTAALTYRITQGFVYSTL